MCLVSFCGCVFFFVDRYLLFSVDFYVKNFDILGLNSVFLVYRRLVVEYCGVFIKIHLF